MRSRARAIVLMLLAAWPLLAGGCGEARELDGSGRPVAVRIGYFANLTHAQPLLGIQDGTFAAALSPTRVETRVFNAGPGVIEALFAGEIDLAYIGPGPAINGFVRSMGQEVVVIAGAAANGVVIVAGRDSGIRTLADLKGKRVATPQHGNTQDLSARIYLTQKLGQPDASNVVPVANAEQLAMLARGQIDAAWSPEPWASRLIAEAGGRLVAEEKDLWPDGQFTLAVVITTPSFLSQHPETVERFLLAHLELTRRLQQPTDDDLAQLNAGLEALAGRRLDESILRDALGRIRFTSEPLLPTLQTFADWAATLGLLPREVELDRLVRLDTLRRVEASLVAGPGVRP